MSLYNWNRVDMEKVTDMLSRKLITGKNVMLAHVYLKKGCKVAEHSHASEQMSYLLKGSLKLRLPDREVTLKEDDVLHIPSGVEHSAVALEDALSLDIFSPIREDWLTGKDEYLRR